MKPDTARLLELQRLLALFNQVERVIHRKHAGEYVRENDTEHSYNLAMTAWYLSPWFPNLDRERLFAYSLVHDLVEVYAGDTYIYGDEAILRTKATREASALQRLEDEWSDFPDMLQSIHEYEDKVNNEARFVYALDKVMPIMQIYIHDGHTWKIEGVTAQMIYDAKREKVALSPEIEPYFTQLYELLLTKPELMRTEQKS